MPRPALGEATIHARSPERDRELAAKRKARSRERKAEEQRRWQEALERIARMRVFPDAAINVTTLAAAIEMAREALGKDAKG